MILDEVLKEEIMLESYENYIIEEAYISGYLVALESLIESLEEEHDYSKFSKDDVKSILTSAKSKYLKAMEELKERRRHIVASGQKLSDTPLGQKVNRLYKDYCNAREHARKFNRTQFANS